MTERVVPTSVRAARRMPGRQSTAYLELAVVTARVGIPSLSLFFVYICATAFSPRAAVSNPPRLRGRICPTAPSGTLEPEGTVTFAVSVTPKGSAVSKLANTNGLTAAFTVKNTGTCPDTFNLTASASGPITVVSVSPSSAPNLQPGASQSVSVTYNVGAPGSGVLTLRAVGVLGSESDNGSYNVTVLLPYSVAVTPDGATTATRPEHTGGYSESFTVKNTGFNSDTYTITCVGYAGVTCTGTSSGSVTLGSLASQTVTASYSVGNPGTGLLMLRATSTSVNDTGTFNVPIAAPAGAPRVDASPYNYATQDYGRCAQNCFTAAYAQSTVPYFSLDAPRSVTLAYNGDRVDLKPFVLVNVAPDSGYGQTPSEYRLQVKVNGAFITFLNGEPTLRFAYPGLPAVRLGGQFDASSDSTAVYPLDILVSAYYAATQSVITNTWKTQLVVVNETRAAVARGWTVAGVQRLYSQGDGTALITQGDGSAVYFTKLGSAFVTPAGDFSTLVTGTPGGGSGWTRKYADSTKVVFDNTGRMTEVRDRFGNATTLVYDGSGRVWQVKDPLNLAITLSYDANGLSTIQDPGGRVTGVTVDASKRLTAIRDPDNVSTSLGYDASNRLSTITNRGNATTTLGYDAQAGKLATITAPAVPVFGEGTVSPVTTFAPWQKVGVPYGPTTTPVAAPKADTVYARVTEPGGAVTRFTVNRWGAPLELTQPLGLVTTTTTDANGLPVKVVQATGRVDTVAYNASGLPTYRKAGADSATYIRYAAYAQPDSVWGYGQQSVRNSIGANGRVDWTRIGGSSTTTFQYDAYGRVDSTADPLGHLLGQTWFQGVNSNRSKDSLPGGRLTTYGYDTYGRQTTVSPAGLATKTVSYDGLNRPTAAYDGVYATPTRTGYDAMYATSVTDAKGQVYRFAYNALGWVVKRTDPASKFDTLAYSRDGELKRWTNRRGQSVDFTYDALHRMATKAGPSTDSVSWTYSADGKVVTTTDPVSTETSYLGTSGRVDSVKTMLAGQTFWRRYHYTQAGLLDSVIPSGGGIAFMARNYVYNAALGALTEIRLATLSTSIGLNADLQPTTTVLPGGDVINRQFFALHGVTDINTSAQYSGTVQRALSYDAGDRIRRQTAGIGGRQYSYDGLGRLVAESVLAYQGVPPSPCSGWPPPDVDENGNPCVYQGGGDWHVVSGTTFTYDSLGNRTDKGGSYGTGNRIGAFDGCSYQSDFDGNVTQRVCGSETVTFTWTAENRLASLTVGTQAVGFHYDAGGRLVRKDVNGTPQRHFLWDADKLLAELDGTATGKVGEYSYYAGLDNPHALIIGTTPYYAQADGLGNLIALTDSAKVVQRDYQYDPWGQLTGGTDTKPFSGADRARFKGALWLGPEVDLYYMRARWYEPKTGRFLSEDPVGVKGAVNPYVYAGDDPVDHSDPPGTCPDGQVLEITIYDDGTWTAECVDDIDYTNGEGRHPVAWGDQTAVAIRGGGMGGRGAGQSCSNVSVQEWNLGQQAIVLTRQDIGATRPFGLEEGYMIFSDGTVQRIIGGNFRRTESSIGPIPNVGWPSGVLTIIHSHPHGTGISTGPAPSDEAAANATGIRVVSAGVGTNIYGSVSRGRVPVNCPLPNGP